MGFRPLLVVNLIVLVILYLIKKNPPHPGHGCGFSTGDLKSTRTCTHPTRTRYPCGFVNPCHALAVPVFNVDGTANTAGSISEVAELILRYEGHSERALFSVTRLGKQNMILGHTWLKEHNPELNWQTGKVEMSRCSPRYCNGCRTEVREERKLAKKEAADISACRTGPFPTSQPAEETSEDEPQTSDIPFDLEEGDRVWATGLLPKAEYVQATSTISQRRAVG